MAGSCMKYVSLLCCNKLNKFNCLTMTVFNGLYATNAQVVPANLLISKESCQ